jgi:hypothetical protein
MALIENIYTGDGSTVLYSFTFPYIEVADVKVQFDGVATTEYSLANATTVELVAAPTSGTEIRIHRDTKVGAPAATFFPGSAIRAQDLNDNFEQSLFVVQEASFNNSQSAADSAAALATAQAADVKSDQANVQSAAAQASAAQAQTDATQAAVDAATAQADATQAATDATAAQVSADQANAAVQAAAIFAPVPNVAAIPSSPADQARVSVLDSTGIASFTPLTDLPIGPTYDSGIYVNLVYQNTGATWEFVAFGPNDPDSRYLLDTVDSVSTSNISNGAITTDELAADSVTTDKIVNDSVTTGKIVNAAVTTDKIADSSVNTDKLAATVILLPTGAITAFGGSTAPTGYLECNGQSTAGYTALAAIVGANVPDLRGEFVRGWDHGRGVDSGRSLGSSQAATATRQAMNDWAGSDDNTPAGFGIGQQYASADSDGQGNFTGARKQASGVTVDHTDNNLSNGGQANDQSGTDNWITYRPRNVALMYIIKT